MDNKRSYKKLATFFWTTLTFLPFIFALVLFVGMSFKGLSNNSSYVDFHTFMNYFTSDFNSITDFFECFTFNMFSELFNDLLGSDSSIPLDYYAVDISIILGYMVSIQFIHLIFDLIVWLPNLFHKWLNKERF